MEDFLVLRLVHERNANQCEPAGPYLVNHSLDEFENLKKKMGKDGKAAKATQSIYHLALGCGVCFCISIRCFESKKENERRFLFNDTIEIRFLY